jgi:hypothetical protein
MTLLDDAATSATPAVSNDSINPPPMLGYQERKRLLLAARRAPDLYPEPVATLISGEILAWEQFGYRLKQGGQMARLVDHILNTPLPQ